MIISVGTTNPGKIKSVKEALHKLKVEAKINSIKTESGVSDQPLTTEECIKGAENRAKNAFKNCDYSIGIEGGLFEFNKINKKLGGAVVCAYNGKELKYGITTLIEYPEKVIEELEKGIELGKVIDRMKNEENTAHAEGAFGYFTDNALTRTSSITEGTIAALAPFIKKHKYV